MPDIEEKTMNADLPAPIAELDVVLPVAALARLVVTGAPVGVQHDRRRPLRAVAPDDPGGRRGAGAWAGRPSGWTPEGEERVEADPGRGRDHRETDLHRRGVAARPARRAAAAPPGGPPPGTEDTLEALVAVLNGLAGVEDVPVEPDAPEGWTVPSWAP
jgi:hypothetical protein